MSAPDFPPPPSGPGMPCARCGANVAPGQDWCLNCGAAATTRVSGATGWRTPLVVVAVILVLATGGLVFAFLALSDDDDAKVVAAAPSPVSTAVVAPTGPSGISGPSGTSSLSGPSGESEGEEPASSATPTPASTSGTTGSTGPTGASPSPTAEPSATSKPTDGAFASWPAGKTAYTVIVYSGSTRAQAEAKARSVTGLSALGILHSNDYSSLRSGYWVVFSGQYGSIKQATAAAKAAQSSAPGAYPKQVKPK